jgi:hypothetical protein
MSDVTADAFDPRKRMVLMHRCRRLEHVARFDRYVAEVEIHHLGTLTLWMSRKQGAHLDKLLGWMPSDYSNKHCSLWITLEDGEKGPRFVWAGLHRRQKSDLPWMSKTFRVAMPEGVGDDHPAFAENFEVPAGPDADLVDAEQAGG